MSSTNPLGGRPKATAFDANERQPLLEDEKEKQLPPAVSSAAVHGLAGQASPEALTSQSPTLSGRDVVLQQPTKTRATYSAGGETVAITIDDPRSGATGRGQPGSKANTDVGRPPNNHRNGAHNGGYGAVVTSQPRVEPANWSNDVVNQALVDFMHDLGYPNLSEAVLNDPNDISLTDQVKGQLSPAEQDTLCKHLNSLKKTLLHERYSASYAPTAESLKAYTHTALLECGTDFQQAVASETGRATADLLSTNGSFVFNIATPPAQLVASSLLWGAMGACGKGLASTFNKFGSMPVLNGLRSQILGGDYRLEHASIDELLPSPCNVVPTTGQLLTKDEFKTRTRDYNRLKAEVRDWQDKTKPHIERYAILLNTLIYGGLTGVVGIGIGAILPAMLATSGVAAGVLTKVILNGSAIATAGTLSGLFQHNILGNKTANIATVNRQGDYDSHATKSMCLLKAKDVLPTENPENKSIFRRSLEKSQAAAIAGRAFKTNSQVLKVLSDEARNRIGLAMAAAAAPTFFRAEGLTTRSVIENSDLSDEAKQTLASVVFLGEEMLGRAPEMMMWPSGLYELQQNILQQAGDEEIKRAITKVGTIVENTKNYISRIENRTDAPEAWRLGNLLGGLEHYEALLVDEKDDQMKTEVQYLKSKVENLLGTVNISV